MVLVCQITVVNNIEQTDILKMVLVWLCYKYLCKQLTCSLMDQSKRGKERDCGWNDWLLRAHIAPHFPGA